MISVLAYGEGNDVCIVNIWRGEVNSFGVAEDVGKVVGAESFEEWDAVWKIVPLLLRGESVILHGKTFTIGRSKK